MRVLLKADAFSACLSAAEPGESGYALFMDPSGTSAPGPRKVIDTEGLSRATLACITSVLARHREPPVAVGETLWYVSLQP